ncbi:PLP-dependent aminotransferase family protein [Intestinimonas timonensis]|uniref:MocR-like pyridoxine biosynthesis transcription factor PdxR n=1 Tax=Intestinimonas timonensis TaxID=1689270 RepID=UPI003A8FCBFC
MITPVLDPSLSTPLYEQLYRQIRRDIESGVLPAGEKLPSKRALSAHLKVSVVTVEGAYGQLLAEGYLRSEPKRGFFVSSLEPTAPPPVTSTTRREEPPTAPTASVPRYDFATNAVDAAHFPFATWAKLMRQVLTKEDSGLLSAIHPQGVPALRSAIVDYLREFRGIDAQPDQVVVGAGSEYLTGILFQLLGREGGYAVENPGYRKFGRILSRQGALICPIPLDEQGLRVDALTWSGARVVHVTPSHHFPLGTVMPVTRRRELLAWAAAGEGRYIIEDDYDSEFRFSGRPIPALQSLDAGERVVYLNTFAKSLAPSLRIGYMVLPPHLAERYRREFLLYSSTVPSFEQYTLARFLEGGHFERHIARMRVEYRDRKAALTACAKELGLHARLSGADAGLHMLLTLENGMGEDELVARAAEEGVAVYPLSASWLTPPPEELPPTLIMGYARLEAEDIRQAFRRLKAAWGSR